MRKLQEVNLTVRVKVDDLEIFPAIETADTLAEFVQILRKSAYTSPLAREGTYLHKAGAVQWSLKNDETCSESVSPEGALDEGLRDQGGHADSSES